MTRLLKHRIWHDLFEAGVLFKALNSVWEVLGGLILLTKLHSWVSWLILYLNGAQFFDHEDLWFHFVNTQLHHLNADSTRLFVGFYFLFHGCMNAFLAYNLYRNRLWAYPTMILFITVFFMYQIIRLMHTHSIVLLLVSVFDAAFIVLTWHEYQYQVRKKHGELL